MMKLDNFARTHVVIWFIIIFLADTAASQSIREKFVVGGYPGISETTPHTLVPSSNIRELPYDNFSEKLNFRANKHAKRWLKKSQKTNALLLIENGKIVFEGYKGLGREDSEFYSMSMSKSLTSLAIGKALCDCTLRGLDVLASEYVLELKPNNNNLGR